MCVIITTAVFKYLSVAFCNINHCSEIFLSNRAHEDDNIITI